MLALCQRSRPLEVIAWNSQRNIPQIPTHDFKDNEFELLGLCTEVLWLCIAEVFSSFNIKSLNLNWLISVLEMNWDVVHVLPFYLLLADRLKLAI